MKTISSRALVAVAGLTVAGGALIATQAAANDGALHASATIEGPGDVSGFATFAEDAGGVVHVNVKVSGLTPGLHGAHIHAIGSCTPNAAGVPFGGAGGHFNPYLAPHGEHTRGEHAEHHAGDLPNLIVNDDGRGRLNTASAHFTLTHAVAESLFDDDKSAIVIHANQDDYVTQAGPLGPGQSGPRIACGEIEEG